MAKETWHYLNNQFETATKGSFKLADILIADHFGKLDAEKSDADILFMHKRFLPVRQEWDKRNSEWLAADGIYQGETKRFEDILNDLRVNKIPDWDIRVQVVFKDKTPDYKAIFPDGRGPFQVNTYERRLAEVEALGMRLGNYAQFAALKTEVNKFHAIAKEQRDKQQAKETLHAKTSDTLEEQRVIAVTMLYANLGRLMDKFADAPQNVERFYQLSVLRNKGNGEGEAVATDATLAPGKAETADVVAQQ